MKIPILVACLALLCQSSYSQSTSGKRKFADTEPLILHYRKLAKEAWEKNDSKLAYTYYDSIKNCIVHSYVGRHQFRTMDNKKYKVGTKKKPIFLTVSATWCAPCRAEIPALNKIVDEYTDKVDFLVLFWDLKKDLTSFAAKYNPRIYLIPSIKKTNEENIIDIAGFKNINGYPSMFLINKDNQIEDFFTGASVPGTFVNEKGEKIIWSEENAYKSNYKQLKQEMDILLKN